MSEDETLEKLFEKYISLKVHQIYTKKGYNVVLQSNKIYLLGNTIYAEDFRDLF